MSDHYLVRELANAYTTENLNKITRNLIELFRGKQYSYLRTIYDQTLNNSDIKETNIHKIFARLISLYHPDKINFYKKQIETYQKNNDRDIVDSMIHILTTMHCLNSDQPITLPADDDTYYSEIYYTLDADDFNDMSEIELAEDNTQDSFINIYTDETNYDFLTVIREKEFGDSAQLLDPYILGNLEGALDLSNSRINDISGIEMCKNIIRLDLSGNQITDITPLGYMPLLEDIYLSQNDIISVEALADKTNLKRLDLSFTKIRDITPLFDLVQLEYLNLLGTKIPKVQVDSIRKNGVLVVI